MRPEIQLEIVWSAPPLTEGTRQVQLMRPYEVAGRSDIEVPLVTIDIRPQKTCWTWICRLSSASGTEHVVRLRSKRSKRVSCQREAMQMAVDEVRDFMHLATAAEQSRIKAWLGYILSSWANVDEPTTTESD